MDFLTNKWKESCRIKHYVIIFIYKIKLLSNILMYGKIITSIFNKSSKLLNERESITKLGKKQIFYHLTFHNRYNTF